MVTTRQLLDEERLGRDTTLCLSGDTDERDALESTLCVEIETCAATSNQSRARIGTALFMAAHAYLWEGMGDQRVTPYAFMLHISTRARNPRYGVIPKLNASEWFLSCHER
jgi:hypothetical protein